MIDPKELRIGNWVYHESESTNNLHAIIVNDDDLGFMSNGGDLYYSPIPLTPEILEKAGFEWSIYHQAFHFGDMAMNEFYDVNECYPSGYQLSTFKKKELIGNSFQYLHQLQNLYFALTGQELEINLTQLS